MEGIDIINFIGCEFLKSNIENGEFSYASALKGIGKNIKDYQSDFDGKKPTFLDLKYANERLSVLIERKDRFANWNIEEIMTQLGMYVRLEKQLTENRIVVILAETVGDGVYVWAICYY